MAHHPENRRIAEAMEEVARLLEEQNANPFRVRAWRHGAGTVRNLDRRLRWILNSGGIEGLQALPSIGRSLSRAIEELLETGRLSLLERLRGVSGHDLFESVPGIGPELALRVRKELHLETLQDLEEAAHDGTLAKVPGFGRGRLRAVRKSLAGRFRRRPYVPESQRRLQEAEAPSVEELLDVDREYRTESERGGLIKIAPHRFNPTGRSWLPVLHTQRGERHYTALFSNTARAHELDATHDWVVIFRDDHEAHGQWTVLTSHYGDLRGQRIVRGREAECRELHKSGACLV